MGKNQAYKAMQRSKVSDGSSGLDQIEDGMVDGSFHSPEWHAARLASLGTSHTVTWEEFKRKQKEDEMKNGEVEADKDRMMKEYRAQLDAERAVKLAKGRNHSNSNTKSDKKKDKDKESRKRSKKHKRSRRHSSDSSSSSSEYSSSESDERESKRSKSRSKHKEKRHRSRSKTSSRTRGEKDEEGPLPLSRFFGNMKN
ncbi:protein FAM133-like [Impatiens glandulifera]|uniref:protein FAM133-like n=1 Tax=Impatiens glandulifera TaxID=253017 RepID=UPI001FB100B2|nr:protein FAM133-like [Impatiens glandulifera]